MILDYFDAVGDPLMFTKLPRRLRDIVANDRRSKPHIFLFQGQWSLDMPEKATDLNIAYAAIFCLEKDIG